jgi:putative transposase
MMYFVDSIYTENSGEGEAPAEPPQTQRRGTHIAPNRMKGALSAATPSTALPVRKRPAHGVLVSKDGPVIVYLTVCTKGREKWLAEPAVHVTLCRVWQRAEAWRVGRYVIMPDHLHLFAAWIDGTIELDKWVQFWKSQFSKAMPRYSGCWQTGHWDTRIRGVKSYESKWEYVRSNPVRHGLVARPEDWPYQGEMYLLDWNG